MQANRQPRLFAAAFAVLLCATSPQGISASAVSSAHACVEGTSPLDEASALEVGCTPPQSTGHAGRLPRAPRRTGDVAYQYNMRAFPPVVNPTTFQQFALPNASAPTILGAQAAKLYAIDFNDVTRTLYAIDNASQKLGTVDQATGVFTAGPVLTGAPVGHVITGLAIDPSSRTAYMSSTDTVASVLSTIDLVNGAVTVVGEIGFEQIVDIAVNCRGQIYGHDIVLDVIVRIDPSSGAGAPVGPTGFDANYAQGMDFDNTDGTLYAWLYQGNGVGELATIDLSTGAATSVSTPPAGEYEGAIPGCCLDAKGNLNGDATPELLFRNLTSNRTVAWLMNGTVRTTGQFVTPDPTSSDWRLIGSDDFDAANAPGSGPDGSSDLVFMNLATRNVEFWLMNGVARVGSARPLAGAGPLAATWDLAATGDFDHDRRPDIVWRNQSSQQIVVWLMNATTKAGEVVPTPGQAVDANWQIVAALDYNHDGNRDFLWYNTSSGKVVLWWLDENLVRFAGLFTTPANAGDANWKVVAGGDYGPGAALPPPTPPPVWCTSDIVWRNDTSAKLVVWHMDPTGTRTSGTFTTPDTAGLSWTVAGPR